MRSGFNGDGQSNARRLLVIAAVFGAITVLPSAATSAAPPALQFSVFSHTGIPLVDIL
jgi:hypothetical protein